LPASQKTPTRCSKCSKNNSDYSRETGGVKRAAERLPFNGTCPPSRSARLRNGRSNKLSTQTELPCPLCR